MLLKIHLLCSRSYSSSTPKICFPPSLTLGDFFFFPVMSLCDVVPAPVPKMPQHLTQTGVSEHTILSFFLCERTRFFFPRLCSEMTAACFSFSSSFTEHTLPIEQSAFTHLLIIFPLRAEVTDSAPHPQTIQTTCDTSLIVRQCWKSSLRKCTVTHTVHIPDVII